MITIVHLQYDGHNNFFSRLLLIEMNFNNTKKYMPTLYKLSTCHMGHAY
jgi:hypothetical protein